MIKKLYKRVFSVFFLITSVVLLSGCFSSDLERVSDIIFNAPNISQTQTHNDMRIGLKVLSSLEVLELFPDARGLFESYHIVYVRSWNKSNVPRVLTFSGITVAQKDEVVSALSKKSFVSRAAPSLVSLPLSIGMGVSFSSPMILAVVMVGSFLFSHFIASSGRDEASSNPLMKKVITYEKGKSMAGVCIVPKRQTHHLIFVPRRMLAPEEVIVTIMQTGQKPHDLRFDFEPMIGE